jgi:hypothetical protein
VLDEVKKMVHCVKCGTENNKDAEFCNKCGSSLYQRREDECFGNKRKEEECFGLPRGGAIFVLFVGIFIIMWGITELLDIEIELWPFMIVIFGILVIVGAIYGLTHRQ